MYENETFETIMQRMLDNLPDDIDKREGSVAYDMLAPKAAELSMSYIELDNVLDFGFASTTYGDFLDKKVAEAGIQRLPAAKGMGSVIFTGEDGTNISGGTVVSTETGIRFLTDESVTISGGTATVTITAEEGGIEGNVPANAITTVQASGVNVNNPEPTTGGSDIETDTALLARYFKKVQQPAVSGNKNHYIQWALEVPGVGDARVISTWNGPGSVKVVIIDNNKNPVSTNKEDEVAEYIETLRPIGAVVTVESAAQKAVDITVDLNIEEGYTLGDVQPAIESEVNKYFKDITFVEDNVKYSKIGVILLSTEGVTDYTNLTINGGTSNIQLTNVEIPTLGTVSLS